MDLIERIAAVSERIQRSIWADEDSRERVLKILLKVQTAAASHQESGRILASFAAVLDDLDAYLETLPHVSP